MDLTDCFVAAGGTSLAVARFLTAVEGEYRLHLRPVEILRQESLAQLAELIDRRREPS